MANTMRVYVTAKDIREGEALSPSHCPLARAIGRAIKRTWPVTSILSLQVSAQRGVYATVFSYKRDDMFGGRVLSYGSWILPPAAVRFVHDVDNFRPVKPASFRLIRIR